VTVRDVEQAVAQRGEQSRKGSVRKDPNVSAQEKLLEERLGTKVSITKRGDKGKITIEFYSNEEFRKLMGELT
jgi:ParB family chromosome partitioning protein